MNWVYFINLIIFFVFDWVACWLLCGHQMLQSKILFVAGFAGFFLETRQKDDAPSSTAVFQEFP